MNLRWPLLLSAACFPAQAHAENAPAGGNDGIVVYWCAIDQIGVATSYAGGVVGYANFEDRPIGRAGELAENVPRLIDTQISGSGKANRYFLRGIKLDHGTDLAEYFDGATVNMRSYGHGQGYLDLNFLIPEMVEQIVHAKDPHRAKETDASEIVVTASPLGGDGAKVADSKVLEASGAVSVADQLARTTPGVSINEMQGNPLQSDINYRGFTASPLLGAPQGLSVYLDGVRLNQPFAEVINWDLIPTSAIARIDLVSGSAPQFGRNSLGGALTLRTKDGQSDPGTGLEASYGSAGRFTANAQWGGHSDKGLNWFVTADHFREDGWRDASPSRATRAFAKLGWNDTRSDVSLSVLFADTNLNGNGLQRNAPACRRPIEYLHRARQHPKPGLAGKPERQPCAVRYGQLQRQRLLAAHPYRDLQRRHQRQFAGPEPLPAQRRRKGHPDHCGLHRVPAGWREPGQHSVPQVALHRQCPAQQ